MIKIIILLISLVSNIFIGIKILQKNKGINNRANTYFAFMCFVAGIWTILIICLLSTLNNNLSIILNKLIYSSTLLIIMCFFMFSIEFPYRVFKIKKALYYILILLTLIIFYIIFSPDFIIGHYTYNNNLYQIENNILNLIYGIYFIILFIISLLIFIRKYILAEGINKTILKSILLATIIPYILGIIFAWYFPHIGKHYLHWLGAVSALLMNLLIAHLIFKKD